MPAELPNLGEIATSPDFPRPPVIDGRRLLAPEAAADLPPKDICDEIGAACRTWGFFQLVNHGVPDAVFARLTAAMHSFFDLPTDVKASVRRSESNAMGWADDELTKQKRDLKEVFDWCWVPHPELPPDHPQNRTLDGFNTWPSNQDEFKNALEAYFNEMTRCAFKLCDAFCIGLGIQPGSLHSLFEQGIGFARLNYYAKQQIALDTMHQQPSLAAAAATGNSMSHNNELQSESPPLGIHHHTDAGFLTILLQDDVAGLEVLHGDDNDSGSSNNERWVSVQPIPGALTINVGDMAQVLSNDEWKAPVHRVIAPTDARRYSVPFFFNPSPDADIAPLPCFVQQGKPLYKAINWGEFRRKRYAGDYKDHGEEEVQISHYKS